VPGDRIERPKRLIEEQQPGKGRQRTSHGDTLALSAGELVGTPGKHARFTQANLVQQLTGSFVLFCRGPAQKPGNERDILLDGPMGEQPKFLDDVADAPPQIDWVEPVDRLPVQSHCSGARLEHSIDEAESGGLSRAASPEQNQGFSAFEIEAEAVQDGPPVDPIADFMEREIRQTAPPNLLLPWDN
jgi:hypothetical protein